MAILTRLVKTQIESLSLYNSEQRIRKTIEDAEEYFTFLGEKMGPKFMPPPKPLMTIDDWMGYGKILETKDYWKRPL